MIGSKLITKQTGAGGRLCSAVGCHSYQSVRTMLRNTGLAVSAEYLRADHLHVSRQVMLARRIQPTHEYYLAILNDRSLNGPALVASARGGMNIEDVARDEPEAIITHPINFENGLSESEYVKTHLIWRKTYHSLDCANCFLC